MAYIESEGKYDVYKFPFVRNDQRDYERALAKLIKAWWDMEYFPKCSKDDVYVSAKDKPLLALSEDEIRVLPDVFRVEAEAAHSRYNRALEDLEKRNEEYNMVKTLVESNTPEDGLKAVERKFGHGKDHRGKDQHFVVAIANEYCDHEYQEWKVVNDDGLESTGTWKY